MNDNLKRTLVDVALAQYRPRIEKAKPGEVFPASLWVITEEMRMFFFEVTIPPQRDFILAVLRQVIQQIGATHAALAADSYLTPVSPPEGASNSDSSRTDALHIGGAVRDSGQTFGLTLPYKRVEGRVVYGDPMEEGIDNSNSGFTGRMTRWFVPPDTSQWPDPAKQKLEAEVNSIVQSLAPVLKPQRRH